MRRIVLLISLMAFLGVACGRDSEIIGSREVSVAYLWGLAHEGSTPIKEDLVLRGYVTLNDVAGETTRSFVVSDESGGLEIKLDAANIFTFLPLGTEVAIHCSGLYVGREGGTLALGLRPTSIYAVDRIPLEQMLNYIVIGEYMPDNLPPMRMAIDDMDYDDMFRYVMVEDVWLIEEERGERWCDVDATTGEYISTVRHFTDGRDTLAIVTAPTAIYAGWKVPTYRARCIGVVDIDKNMVALRLSNHQITPMEE